MARQPDIPQDTIFSNLPHEFLLNFSQFERISYLAKYWRQFQMYCQE